MKLTRIRNPQSSLLPEHIEEQQVFPRRPCKPPNNFTNRKTSQSKVQTFIFRTKNQKPTNPPILLPKKKEKR